MFDLFGKGEHKAHKGGRSSRARGESGETGADQDDDRVDTKDTTTTFAGLLREQRKLTKDEREWSMINATRHDKATLETLDRLRKKNKLNLDLERSALDQVALVLRAKLFLTVHRRLVHSYQDCFKGSEAVTWLVTNLVCTDPEDAKNVMRHLLYRRIILRVDHTKPMFNSLIHPLAPSLAEWRQKKQLQWYQEGARKYAMSALYTFNICAFAKYQLVVRLVGATGLRYTKHSRVTGKWETRRVAPLASVSLGGFMVNTSVEERTSEPRWDETFIFDLDDSFARHDEIWIKVFDFREIGESLQLGVVCVPTKRVLARCGVAHDGPPPPIFPQDAVSWTATFPLIPPATANEPEETRGGMIEVEFQVITNVVSSPDETVHDQCRPTSADHIVSRSRRDEETDAVNHPHTGHVPHTVQRYQHVDRRASELVQTRDHLAANDGAQPVSSGATEVAPHQGEISAPDQPHRWKLVLDSLELHQALDIAPGSVVWVDALVRTTKKSEYLSEKRKSASPDRRKSLDSATGVISRKRGVPFLWPKDRRKVIKAGCISLVIPEDVAKYTTVEIRLFKRKDLPTAVMVGKGRLAVQHVRRASADEDGETDPGEEEDSDSESQGKVAGFAGSKRQSSYRTLGEGDEESFRPADDDATSLSSSKTMDPLDKAKVMDVDDLPPQQDVDPQSEDAKIVVLRKQAAFKRNIKIKSAQVLCIAKMLPLFHDEDPDGALPEDAFDSDPEDLDSIDIDEALAGVIPPPGHNKADIVPVEMPEPFDNIYEDVSIKTSVQLLAHTMLGSSSKFTTIFNKARNNKDVVVGQWHVPKPEVVGDEAPSSIPVEAEEEIKKDEHLEISDDESDVAGIDDADASDSFIATDSSFAKIGDIDIADDEPKSTPDEKSTPQAVEDGEAAAISNDQAKEPQIPPQKLTEPGGGEAEEGRKQEEEDDDERQQVDADQQRVQEEPPQGQDDESPPPVHQEHVDTPTNPTRKITFTLPPTGIVKGGPCVETQEILEMHPGGFVFLSTSDTPTMPYASKFFTRSQFVVSYISDSECRLRISGEVVWKEGGPPGFPIKGFILSGVKSGHTDAYKAQVKMLKDHFAPSLKREKSRINSKSKKGLKSTDKTAAPTGSLLQSLLRVLVTAALVAAVGCLVVLGLGLASTSPEDRVAILEEARGALNSVVQHAAQTLQSASDSLGQMFASAADAVTSAKNSIIH